MKAKVFRNKKAAQAYIAGHVRGWHGPDVDIVRATGARRWIVRKWAPHGRSVQAGGALYDWFVLADDAEGSALQLTGEACAALMASGRGACPHRHEAGFVYGMPAAVGGWVCVYDGTKVSWSDPNEHDRWVLMHPDTGGLTYIHSRDYAAYTMRAVAQAPDANTANGICEIFAFDPT